MSLDHSAALPTTQVPLNVVVNPDVVLSILTVGAGVSPEATGALVGSDVTGSAEEGDSEGLYVSFGGALGVKLGEDVGDRETVDEGDPEGVAVGLRVIGEALGSNVGVDVGRSDGIFVGTSVGD